jgi:hypothetical protein
MTRKEFVVGVADASYDFNTGEIIAEAFAERVIGIYFLAYPDGRDSVGYPGNLGMELGGGSDGCAEGTK